MSILKKLLNLLYPVKCVFCHKLLSGENIRICDKCRESLPYAQGECFSRSFQHIEKCISALEYTGDVCASLHRYKFSSVLAYCEPYSELLLEALEKSGIEFDVLSWVPLSRKRLRERGYDQSFLLATALAKRIDYPVSSVLIKRKNVAAQSGAGNRESRMRNIAGAYIPFNSELIENKSVLLIDDIVTTGSTLSECAGVLLDAGCSRVYALTVAGSVM